MSGYCFRYKNKMVIHTSGTGNPRYTYSLCYKKDFNQKTELCFKRIYFGYNTNEDKNKAIIELKQYVKKHYYELYECNSDCIGFNTCKNVKEF